MTHIIGISGKIGSGKDTMAGFLKAKFEREGYKVEIKKFADKLKQITAIIAGVELEECYTELGKNRYIPAFNMTLGQMQQRIGTEVMRDSFDQQVWCKSAFADYSANKNLIWIFTDVRFPNEYTCISDRMGFLIRINGDPAGVRKNSNRDMSHPSETSLDSHYFPFIIENTSDAEWLKDEVEEFADRFIRNSALQSSTII